MDLDDIDSLAARRRGVVFYASLLLVLVVTWWLFTPVFLYIGMGDNARHLTGRVDGPATYGYIPAFDKALAPALQAIGCHDISFDDSNRASHRVPLCFFTLGGLSKDAEVKLLYDGGDAAIDDSSAAIRAGVAASLWLNFSILVLYRIRR